MNRGSSRTNEDRYGTSGAGPASDDHVPAPSAADAYETPSDDGSPSRERGYHRRRRRPGRGSCGSTCEPFTLREAVLFTWALLASATAVIVLAFVLREGQMRISSLVAEQGYSREESFLSPLFSTHSRTGQPRTRPLSRKRPKRNLIFMVSDGMGPTSLSLTRSFSQLISSAPFNNTLSLDASFHGTSRTRSSWSLVTDSAAGATAFGCGRKTYNGAIGMTDKFEPCATVMEAAKRLGYYTGLVVTTDVSDATPASFIAHAYYRAMMDDIALQEVGNGTLGRVADVLMGGGRCHFLPNTTTGSCRADDIDVLALARSAEFGWNYVDDRAGFDALDGGKNVSLPLLGLFADNDLPFHIDRREGSKNAKTYPSLGEMAATAIKALHDAAAADDDSPGVFLMIEGSRIDHAGHENDPAAQVWEVLEYDGVWAQMKAWLDASGEEGALVSTSDHETGGLATAWRK